MTGQRFESVWDALADTPEEAENLRVRSYLMRAITAKLDEFGWSQAVAASNLGSTQPRISDLVNGKIHKFSLDKLVNLASGVGLHVVVQTVDVNEGDHSDRAVPC